MSRARLRPTFGLPAVLMAWLLSLSGPWAADRPPETLGTAHYEHPVSRYGHFALGRPHEYARVRATTTQGRELSFELPENEVFEDLAPRLVRLSASEAPQLLAIVSRREDGARLVLLGLRSDRLEISAQSDPIGTPMRWLNPVGVADLDGDGQAEIAAVTTPHIGGTLRVYSKRGTRLLERASLPGFSNHILGSSELALSMPVRLSERSLLLVPALGRRRLRLMGLQAGQLQELGHCDLDAPIVGPLHLEQDAAGPRVTLGTAAGERRLDVRDCLR